MRIVSGGTSRPQQQDRMGSGHAVTRSEILRLMKERDTIDGNIQALGQILKSNNIGMLEPLVDGEGFPRNDIDVYQVRHARHQIICLQNDFKSLTNEIEAKLEILHQQFRAQGLEPSPMEQDEVNDMEAQRSRVPIAKVNLVSDNSPAFHAGLQVDDLIISFGSLDSENFQSITDISTIVQRSRGSMVSVNVKRQNRNVKIALIPGEWAGRGLLGCNIVPFEDVDR